MVRRRRTPQTPSWMRWAAAAVLAFLLVWVAMTWGDREVPPHGSGPQMMPGEQAPAVREPPAATDPDSARQSPRERGESTMEPARGDEPEAPEPEDGEGPGASSTSPEVDPERIAQLTRAADRAQASQQEEPATLRTYDDEGSEDPGAEATGSDATGSESPSSEEGDGAETTGASDDPGSDLEGQDVASARELQRLIDEEEVDDLETLEALASERGLSLDEMEMSVEDEALAAEELAAEEELAAVIEDELEAEVDALLYGEDEGAWDDEVAGVVEEGDDFGDEAAGAGMGAETDAFGAAGGTDGIDGINGTNTENGEVDWAEGGVGMTPAGALAALGGVSPEQVAGDAAGYAWASTSALILALEALRMSLADQPSPARVAVGPADVPEEAPDGRADDEDADLDEEDDADDDRDAEDEDEESPGVERPDDVLPVEESTLIWAAWGRGVTELRRVQTRHFPGLAWILVEVEEALDELSPGLPLEEQSEALGELVRRVGAFLEAAEALGAANEAI